MAKANFGGTWAPSTDSQSGWINAVDADTGALRWKYHAEGPAIAGVTPTAGGVLLSGDAKGDFFIFESSTGKLLKEFDTGGSIAGGVITYDVKGKQYVALTSGSVSRATWGALGRPSVIILSLPVQVQATAHAGGPDLARGKQLYSSTCALCHGADGKNISGFDLSSIAPTMSEDQLVAWIKNPAPPMPKMFAEPLNADDETEIRDIAAFLSRRGLGAR
jgi:mono/diheme cytochrome c family protein